MAFSSLAPSSAEAFIQEFKPSEANALIQKFKPSDAKAWFTKYHIFHLAMSEEAVQARYFGYLLATAKIREIDVLLTTYTYDKDYLLNTQNIMFYDGTALHMALYWHNGAHGLALFNLLIKHGARIYKTPCGLPWEQMNNQWIQPVNAEVLGIRNPDDFAELYQDIKHAVEELQLPIHE
jgi:hypothetical protein